MLCTRRRPWRSRGSRCGTRTRWPSDRACHSTCSSLCTKTHQNILVFRYKSNLICDELRNKRALLIQYSSVFQHQAWNISFGLTETRSQTNPPTSCFVKCDFCSLPPGEKLWTKRNNWEFFNCCFLMFVHQQDWLMVPFPIKRSFKSRNHKFIVLFQISPNYSLGYFWLFNLVLWEID